MKKYSPMLFLFFVLFLFSSCRTEMTPTAPKEITVTSFANNTAVRYPNAAETIIIGEKYPINWHISEEIVQVNICLYKDSKHCQTIVRGTYNDSVFKWNVSDEIVPSKKYQIKIENYSNPDEFYFSQMFMVSRPL